MKISATKASNRFGACVDAALSGEPVVVTRHGRPVALIEPVALDVLDDDGRPVSQNVAELAVCRCGHSLSNHTPVGCKACDCGRWTGWS